MTNKIAMIIAHRDFRDEEYFIPKRILMSRNFEIITVSTSNEKAIGMHGGEVRIDAIIDSLIVDDFDALLFIGGAGVIDNIDNHEFHRAAKTAVEKGKVLGAICVAPMILAKAGVLNGRKATVWSSPMNKNPIKVLEENGAVYEEDTVVVDKKIITANGPLAADQFAQTVAEALTPTP
ncbi:MAG: DJ-1/PfpI family protein [Minisyncoccales bacterium]